MSRRTPGFTIREAAPAELTEVGALTVDAYGVSSEFTGAFSPAYDAELRDAAGRAASSVLLVAVDESGAIVGTATLAAPGAPSADIARTGEHELRMLGVRDDARGRGIGRALVEETAFRAGLAGADALVISVYVANTPAARMYADLGFVRMPERDWEPEPGIRLEVSRRELHCPRCGELRDVRDHTACDASLTLEPPRFCPACKRRMTVQVRPRGWTATCSAHGTAESAQ